MAINHIDRPAFKGLLRRTMFFTLCFEIYGCFSGFYDYGPPSCSSQLNFGEIWSKHFVQGQDVLKVVCTLLTSHEILQTGGHVDKFAD